jgi:hypothetical protein
MSTHHDAAKRPRLEESMRNELVHRAACSALAIACLAGPASAQTPAPQGTAAGDTIIVVEKPTYVAIPLEITVNRPVAEVWKRVGGYCAIGEWLQIPGGCKMLSGQEGEVGSVRSVATEVLVGKTEYSYTYTQPVRAGRPYNLYHGTLEARAMSPTTTKLLYTIMYDNSMLADDAARAKDRAGREATFKRALANMKTLAEGGTLPPPPARGGAPAPSPAPGGRGNN